ncbi:unnamed protein product [Rotaria sp. Silwood2]|nr:unnamed protein product [Rotaria sp. Silwood2]
MANVHEDVQNYYGVQLQQSHDLKTDACSAKAYVPSFIKDIIKKIHPEVTARYFGCGLVFPPKLEGCRVLDLGCGSGRDVYILSSLVGAQGYVVGVDMTKEQLDVANRFVDYHTKEFGFEKVNVEFRLGKIEQLTDDPELKTNSFDVAVSNCVVNLSPDKKKVLQQVYEMLKPGGEFYFSDMYADRPIPKELHSNKILWVKYTYLGDIKYASCTYRLFKNKSIEDLTTFDNKYGALVTYITPITNYEHELQFDQSITLKLRGQPQYLNAELIKMLRISRYSENFKIDPVTDEKEISDLTTQH